MDAKVTLSFDKKVIEKAKAYAAENNISLSRLTEYLYKQIISGDYKSLEELPISDWVYAVAEGEPEYKTPGRNRKKLREEYFQSKK